MEMNFFRILVIDDESEIRLSWLHEQFKQLLGPHKSYSVTCMKEVPTYTQLIQLNPELICWDNDLGLAGETADVLHTWIWKTSGVEGILFA